MPTSMITVQHRDGGAAQGVRVTLGFAAGNSKPAHTDRYGRAVVEHNSTGRATVYVSGRNCGSFHAPGRYVAIV